MINEIIIRTTISELTPCSVSQAQRPYITVFIFNFDTMFPCVSDSASSRGEQHILSGEENGDREIRRRDHINEGELGQIERGERNFVV